VQLIAGDGLAQLTRHRQLGLVPRVRLSIEHCHGGAALVLGHSHGGCRAAHQRRARPVAGRCRQPDRYREGLVDVDGAALKPLVSALGGPATVHDSEQSSYKDGLQAERWVAAQCGIEDVDAILPEHWRTRIRRPAGGPTVDRASP
jgi:hypothetical protein